MKGTRPLNNNEIRRVCASFDGTYAVRNRGLFVIGVSTGGRISELLSLRVADVYQNGQPVSDLLYEKSVVKGGEVARAIPVNVDGRQAVEALIHWHRDHYGSVDDSRALFASRQGCGAIDRRTADGVLKKAFETAGLNGKLATHSMRKSFAQRLYDQTGDIFAVQEMLGHKNVATTQRYLGVNYASVRTAVEKMAFSETAKRHPDALGTHALKSLSDHALFLELGMRGYDLAQLRTDGRGRENQPQVEIVNIS